MSKSLAAASVQKLTDDFRQDPSKVVARNAVAQNGATRAALNRDFVQSISHVYSDKVSTEGKPVTSQKVSGRCWLFAVCNVMRSELMKKYNIEELELSQPYLFFFDKLERANYFLENVVETVGEPLEGRLVSHLLLDPLCDGGQWDMIVNLVKKYGVVPKEHFQESYATSNSRHMNWLLTHKLRQFARDLRAISADGGSEADMRTAKDKMITEVHRILCTYLGTPPSKFTWSFRNKDKNYTEFADLTPTAFYEEHIKPVWDIEDKVCLIHDPRPNHPPMKLYTVQYLGNVHEGYPVRYINVDIDVLRKAAIQSIRGNEIVWFGCDVGKFFDRELGVMSMDIFDFENVFGTSFPMTKAERLLHGESLMTHAMAFTGVNVQSDQVTKWRVENSWGDKVGDKGYLMMTNEWFDEYVFEVVVDKKFVSQEIADVAKQEPVVLPPWDPMGALA